ncbi:hypothetical protein PFICI_09291 [Pestalotiopsis fici W106-1]|uniref:Sodium/calcium exchanger membrane region domain-containing protein n=1 Tax=Pestalotiopsis fici (strain W106-1 / CGMCC3.15140) TaxID=1229662 RepID=W3WZX8_PESFW|nr:uncharacterized protein PFICI_09291 [Pestalotiopsis fici W106-1]ETS79438.1 hypothetical protein PFICI_09291 [Pestalotiopsis fici W106-1]
MDIGDVLFNAAAFLAGLSLLERGARLFVSSATTLAKRLRLPDMLVGILVAGAEWEELAVVALSLAQKRPALAVGNIIGSTIANIFGAFALGLIFSTRNWDGFERDSKVACLGLLALTTFVSLFALADILWYRVVAVILLVIFVIYVLVVLWSIWQAMSYTKKDDDAEDIESGAAHDHLDDASSSSSSECRSEGGGEDADESTALLSKPASSKIHRLGHNIMPILQLLGSFLALALSGFILSRTSTLLAASFDMSDSAFGATILALATTLPEKFVAVASGIQGHSGLLVADAVGSNIFLLTLCLGMAAWSVAAHQWHDHPEDGGHSFVDVSRIEAWWMWAASIALTAVVFIGSKDVCKVVGVRQLLGALLLIAYGGFLAVEFTVLRD